MESPAVEIESIIPKPESYGALPITDELVAKFTELTKTQPIAALKRHIFNGHIGFDAAIEHATSGKPLYIYLPISPSDRLTTLRHALFLNFAKFLQTALNCYLFIHVNDYKAYTRETDNIKYDAAKKWTEETIRDILAFEFNKEKTIVLTNTSAVALNYVMLCDLQRKCPLGEFFHNFFTDDNVNVGTIDAVFQEATCAIPAYVEKIFPGKKDLKCLMLLRASQEKLFHFACSLCDKISAEKPYAIFGGFVPAPQSGQKMPKLAKFALGASPNDQNQKGGKQKNSIRDYMSIYIKNTPKEIATKINKFAFSGGKDTIQEHKEKGANLAVDIPTYYLKIFLEDDAEYERIVKHYGPGVLPEGEERMLSGELKKKCGEVLANFIKHIQEKRTAVTKEDIEKCYKLYSL
ncbi:hypothetical protein TVAG_104060 [Trichomonas vaginalis G3]|uniref:tryptophan--tRNA ligase n=1 Tax=Trichomonas vaginalis (strain ATCC PRA-98 / G3) TaxID=412133 RepID=A2FN45_TRIV3|nr:tryptophanyl-tRNA aminoacylation [Trichomonas vaginalis G3]EAX93687.1 hypothetical protein TVAG_104060 [Trichomonas vaginalis G3]KAI5540892.1 tryptophanyl-tRNA aminoacylation [Trichomonas vaginalis G3]|eukprot:XP_001306617.1 hypothetical protein [Trichomonas vaginalis G3]